MSSETKLADSFLKENSVWEGEVANFVNMKGGVIQHGRLIVEMTVDLDGVITQKNILVRPDGQRAGYEGVARMRVEGNRLMNVEPMTEDPNTKNRIQNHLLEGFVGDKHIYILESYDEVFPDGHIEHRRNALHHYFLSRSEIILLSDVFVDDKLLVFANVRMRKVQKASIP